MVVYRYVASHVNRVLVTGANGFIGRALVSSLFKRSHISIVAGVRTVIVGFPTGVTQIQGLELRPGTLWASALNGVTQVVHLAWAGGHVVSRGNDNKVDYWRSNVDGSLDLAEQAANAGVRRFVFMSTVKVNGENTRSGSAFSERDVPQPQDAYGQSKYEVEQRLLELSKTTPMETVIIRPPLVYGPGVKGNFRRLLVAVSAERVLPLASVHNRRSMVALDNLVDFITVCLEHPKAANQVLLVSDGNDLATPDLIRKLAEFLGVSTRLVPVPVTLMRCAAMLLGKRAVAQRVLGDLQVNINEARNLLGWEPPVSVESALGKVAAAFLAERSQLH